MKLLRLLFALTLAVGFSTALVRAEDKEKCKDDKACTCGKDKDGKACGVDKDCCCTGEKASAKKPDESKPAEPKPKS